MGEGGEGESSLRRALVSAISRRLRGLLFSPGRSSVASLGPWLPSTLRLGPRPGLGTEMHSFSGTGEKRRRGRRGAEGGGVRARALCGSRAEQEVRSLRLDGNPSAVRRAPWLGTVSGLGARARTRWIACGLWPDRAERAPGRGPQRGGQPDVESVERTLRSEGCLGCPGRRPRVCSTQCAGRGGPRGPGSRPGTPLRGQGRGQDVRTKLTQAQSMKNKSSDGSVFLGHLRKSFLFSFGDTWIGSRTGCPREGSASSSARGRERGREGETEGGREGGRAAAAAVARASLPRREAAALHLWPWGAKEQVTEALPEAGLDEARGPSLPGLCPTPWREKKVGRSAPAGLAERPRGMLNLYLISGSHSCCESCLPPEMRVACLFVCLKHPKP